MIRIRSLVPTLALLVLPGLVAAAPNGPAETSLEKCQNTLRKEGPKYVQLTHKAIAGCLGKVAVEVLRQNEGAEDAVGACNVQFAKIGRSDGKSIAAKFDDKVIDACTPGGGNAHTLADLLGSGVPGVAEPGNVAQLGIHCAAFGGDGSVDSLGEWVACVKATQDCAIRSATVAEFPRAVEWLGGLAAEMPAGDAKNAVLAAEAAMDGPNDDGLPSISCGPSQRFLATGTTAPFGADKNDGVPGEVAVDDDGTLGLGAALAYVDNGDGTVTDLNTGLMWGEEGRRRRPARPGQRLPLVGRRLAGDHLGLARRRERRRRDGLRGPRRLAHPEPARAREHRRPRRLRSERRAGVLLGLYAGLREHGVQLQPARRRCTGRRPAQAATPADYAWGVYFFSGTMDAYARASDTLAVRAVRYR